METNNSGPGNNASVNKGEKDKVQRTRMKNENGQHSAAALSKAIGNRAKSTGSQTGNKD
jgi:hypothetical protein